LSSNSMWDWLGRGKKGLVGKEERNEPPRCIIDLAVP